MSKPQLINRYTSSERSNHWAVAITFILLALSGLALFHPAFFFLTNLFGGGVWARILHPFIGVVLFVLFVYMALGFAQHNRITNADREWMKRIKDVVLNNDDKLPAVGKYNAGQKYLFWTLVVCIPLLFVTGVIIWQPYFAPIFPVTLLRLAVLLHALAAFVSIAGIMVHIYAAIWVKGSIRAMIRGTVSKAWAKHHHAAWLKEITK
ncbi:MAG TPA: formate dehydrogenase subunit gamma [Gallionellaceae bacterium]|nr:formate dehydrogenase subunit gamma [Gallionellaceae bacterium]